MMEVGQTHEKRHSCCSCDLQDSLGSRERRWRDSVACVMHCRGEEAVNISSASSVPHDSCTSVVPYGDGDRLREERYSGLSWEADRTW